MNHFLKTRDLILIFNVYDAKKQKQAALENLKKLIKTIESDEKVKISDHMANVLNSLFLLEKIYEIDYQELLKRRNKAITDTITFINTKKTDLWICKACKNYNLVNNQPILQQLLKYHVNNHEL